MNLKKYDHVAVGVIIGIILPTIFYYLLVHPRLAQYKFLGNIYLDLVVKMLPMFLSRCIFPNAVLFFILLWTDMARAAKGMLIVTGIATGILLFISFVL